MIVLDVFSVNVISIMLFSPIVRNFTICQSSPLTFLDHLLVQGRPIFLSSSVFDLVPCLQSVGISFYKCRLSEHDYITLVTGLVIWTETIAYTIIGPLLISQLYSLTTYVNPEDILINM